ncbi:transmembrane emp24 domain-containing protein 5-like [Pomacea canaliculata]|uniref:transmembrane emp24 domain-containing protein 5-like n=1 Tax=Pomacea canaliculata TaxID=400727 RepID=UPI000D7327D4|nr:transmembrane emp24 domain-containing protein 5-like [Pomacea canaliculata]
MEGWKLVVVSVVFCTTFYRHVHTFEIDLTIEIRAGVKECFWQHIKRESSAELEYQVIDGGDLDIDFTLQSPDGRIMHMETRKTENVLKVNADVEGEYKFCFDNTFSRMSPKVVFFEIISDYDDDEDDDDWNINHEEVVGMVDLTVEEFKGIIERAKGNLDKSIQIQNLIKVHEARDRNIAEANFIRVNVLSAVQLFVMVTVGLIQVIMIRSLFGDTNKTKPGLKQKT